MPLSVTAAALIYATGTVSSATDTITGSGSAWQIAGIRAGDTVVVGGTKIALIKEVSSNSVIKVEPALGTIAAGTSYAILRNPGDSVEMTALLREVIAGWPGGGDILTKAAQTLTAVEKKQARSNLGAQQSMSADEAPIAIVGVTDLGSVDSVNLYSVGAATITSFGTATNLYRKVRFTSASLVVNNDTSLRLPAGEDILTKDGDVLELVSDSAGNWRALAFTQPLRAKLTDTAIFYVRLDGHDANSGLANTSTKALRTIQQAISKVQRSIDMGAQVVRIKVQGGEYAEGGVVSGPWTGGATVIIEAVGTVTITAPVAFSADRFASLYLTGPFVYRSTVMCLSASLFGTIYFDGGRFDPQGNACIHIYATRFGYIEAQSGYSISAGGSYHVLASHTGNYRQQNGTVTILADITFTGGFIYSLTMGDATLTGTTSFSLGSFTVTAVKFIASGGHVQWSNHSPDDIPGSAAGQEYNGGRFIGSATDPSMSATAFSYDLSSASATMDVAVPFRAESIDFTGAVDGTTAISDGWYWNGAQNARGALGANWYSADSMSLIFYSSGNDYVTCSVTATSAAAVILTFTKHGSPTGTAKITMRMRKRL